MIELTEPQREALNRESGEFVTVVDPGTKETFVLVRSATFDRLRAALIDDFSVSDAYPLLDAVARQAGWDDPEWDSYDVYAREKKP